MVPRKDWRQRTGRRRYPGEPGWKAPREAGSSASRADALEYIDSTKARAERFRAKGDEAMALFVERWVRTLERRLDGPA